mgnify:FL=1|jgi:DNA-binding FadR family transcriptional regulator
MGDKMSTANETTETLETNIVRRLGDLIVTNNLSAGDRLPPIRELAVQFGVKASAVRDALLTVQAKGLIKVLPRVGAIVQPNADPHEWQSIGERLGDNLENVLRQGDQNLFHILETRETLEMTMVAKAAQRRDLSELFRLRGILADMSDIPLEIESPEYAKLDVEFHLEIGRLSGNSVMTSLLRSLLHEVRPYLDRIRWLKNQRAAANRSHSRIYSALVAGDAAQAQAEMQDHIQVAYNSLLNELREPPTMNGVRTAGSAS